MSDLGFLQGIATAGLAAKQKLLRGSGDGAEALSTTQRRQRKKSLEGAAGGVMK